MNRRATRSSARSGTPQRDSDDDLPIVKSSVKNGHAVEDPVLALETHVSKVVQASRTLKQEYVKLQKKHAEVEAELADTKEQLAEHEQPKRGSRGAKKGAASVPQLQKTVVELKGRVKKLEKTRARDKRKIAKLEAREIKRDAEELQDQAEFELGDSVHVMRKLLRRFHDLMLANPLEESQECAICLTAMEVGNATGLPCQHIFCSPCIRELIAARKHPNQGNPYVSDEEEDQTVISCPECRALTKPGDMEVIEYTASTQWDALLEVAAKSAKLDRRRGDMDTSDEEEEEERVGGFIDDEQSEEARSSVVDNEESHHSEAPAGENGLSSPEPVLSPSKGKRKLRVQTPSSEGEEAVASDAESALTDLDETDANGVAAEDAGQLEAGPSTPRRTRVNSTPSFLQSPATEKRRRLEELADARQAKEKKRRFG